MSRGKDYIPPRDADFDGWLGNVKGYVSGKTSGGAWTHIPADKVTGLAAVESKWHTAYVKTLAPHTKVDTETKNSARKEATAFIRPFVAQYLKFEPVSDEDRTSMRIPNKDAVKTAIGKPSFRPVISQLNPVKGFRVEVRFHNEPTPTSRAIPYGCNGCLLYYTWGPERVSDYAAFTQTVLMTRSPFVITLPPDVESKYLSCAARWQTERGELGPWSEIQYTVCT